VAGKREKMPPRMPLRLAKLISGGQTGVDRAALDVALELGLSCGGYCPKGRRAEDGPLAARYPLEETPSRSYAQRTEWNVRDSDGTLVLCCGAPDRGTALTLALARRLGRPSLTIDLSGPRDGTAAREWIAREGIRVLNVAGPRESRSPGSYAAAAGLLRDLLEER
jgi:hypothetical protein